MAATNVPIQYPLYSGGTVPSGGSLNTSDGNVIAAGGYTTNLLVEVDNTGPAGTIIIGAGNNPPALRASLGALSINIGGTERQVLLIESARFADADGDINITFGGSPTGTVYAYEVQAVGIS